MENNKRWGIGLIALGLVLLLASALLLRHNHQESDDAGQAAADALSAVQQAISENASVPTTQPPAPPEETQAPEKETDPTAETRDPNEPEALTEVEIDGHKYVGYLYFPDLDRSLPVMKLEYVEDLQLAPCLQVGSVYTNDAVIAAHNYPSHFGPLRDYKGGERVRFTDMTGYILEYTVQEVRTIDPKETPDLTENPYDLTLYTCTTGGKDRVLISCNRAEKNS